MQTNIKGLKIAANSFFHQMREYGYSTKQIIQTVNELLDLVTAMIRDQNPPGPLEDASQKQAQEPQVQH